MINTQIFELCCGCSMCSHVCPKNAITMAYDDMGFQIPDLDRSLCINCGRCEKVCPIQNTSKLLSPLEGYIVQCKKLNIRKESTSGGAFTPIADYVLASNGVVYGVQLKNNIAEHCRITKSKELELLRNSKYVQSKMSSVLDEHQLEKDLSNRGMVLFSGTPCQINAVKNAFPRAENLLTIEVMCREVVAPLLLSKYIEYLESKNNKHVKNIRFRDKKYGYHYSVLKAIFDDATEYYKPLNYDPYLKAFFSDCFARDSCYRCPYRKEKRRADITIWDAWDVDKYSNLLHDDWGATKILINSELGKKVINICLDSYYFESVKVDELLGDVITLEKQLSHPSEFMKMRQDLIKLSGEAFFDKYWPRTMKVKIRFFIKTLLYKKHIFQFIRKITQKFSG